MKNYKQDCLELGLTKHAAKLYFTYPHEETEKLVSACAIKDWGNGTACVFSEVSIVVEHLDGRKELLLNPKSAVVKFSAVN